MVSLVNLIGLWNQANSSTKIKIENPGPVFRSRSRIKSMQISMLPYYWTDRLCFLSSSIFVSCFGSSGPTAVRCIFFFADFEL